MINLARHIEILLLEHDCVIVPGLGGFIANHAQAKYNDGGDKLFLPPYRTIGFNQELKANDGLLVQSYMSVYDASYPDAYKQMEMDVEEATRTLDLTGSYTLKGIGTLKKGLSGSISFEPLSSGILTPSLYGLYSIEMKSLAEAKQEREIAQSLRATNILPIQAEGNQESSAESVSDDTPSVATTKKGDVVIHLNRRWVDLSIASAISVILFFLFFYPSMNTNQVEDTCVAGAMITSPKKTHSVQAQRKEKRPVVVQEEIKPEQEKAQVAESETTTVEMTDSANTFVIVMASYVSESNATQFIQNLNKKGYDEARYMKTGKISRIVYSNYPSNEKAMNALKSLREKSEDFKEAWTMKLGK